MLPLRVTDYPARGTMPPHYHEEPSLIVVVSGAYLERIQGAEIEHCAGRMLFYPARAMHSQRFGAAGARKIVFTPTPSSMEFFRDRAVSLDAARYVDAPVISQLAQRVLAEMRNDDPFTPLALDGILMELAAVFARTDQAAGWATPPAWVRAARDAIRESEDLRLSLDDIATAVGRHPVHLAREFRRYFGTTVGEYRRRLRLQRAEAMLRKKVGLTEVALACGFASHSHFCRSFKTEYGLSPSQFRSEHAGRLRVSPKQ